MRPEATRFQVLSPAPEGTEASELRGRKSARKRPVATGAWSEDPETVAPTRDHDRRPGFSMIFGPSKVDLPREKPETP